MKTITYDDTKWKLVPVAPTTGMVCAAVGVVTSQQAREAYAAMLAAAPTPHAACPAPVDATEAAEREHMGCAHCGTGIYARTPAGDAGQTDKERLDYLDRYAVITKPGQSVREAIDAAIAASQGEKDA